MMSQEVIPLSGNAGSAGEVGKLKLWKSKVCDLGLSLAYHEHCPNPTFTARQEHRPTPSADSWKNNMNQREIKIFLVLLKLKSCHFASLPTKSFVSCSSGLGPPNVGRNLPPAVAKPLLPQQAQLCCLDPFDLGFDYLIIAFFHGMPRHACPHFKGGSKVTSHQKEPNCKR